MVFSPILGLIVGYFAMVTVLWIFRHRHPGKVNRGFRFAQTASAASVTVQWGGVWDKVVIPMVFSPILGLIVGYIAMVVVLWIFRRSHPGKVNRGFRLAQTASAASMALGHGLQDAQKTMGVIVLALVATGHRAGFEVPLWTKVAAAAAISLGTWSGGWRVMRTLGRRVIELDPARGFAAESTSSSILYATAFLFKAPVSTTHVITSSIMGVGATKRRSAVRWGVAGNIVTAWLLTLPAAGLVAASAYWLLHFWIR
jgi:PiT family inorganic phosphate transporter